MKLTVRNDPAWVASFRAGDRATLEGVYRAHAPSIGRYVSVLVGSRGRGEGLHASALADILQEVFTRAFSQEARRAYDPTCDYERYLAAIARNCFIDLLRKRRREVLIAPEELPQHADTSSGPEDWCDARTLAVLEEYLVGLPEALRAAYQQRFVLEQSQEQTAAALGISRKAVRGAEQRLRDGLRRALMRARIPLRRATADSPPVPGPAALIPSRGRGRI